MVAQRDATAKLKSCWGFESELQTNPMLFHLDLLWGATLMRVSKNSRVILSCLWANIHEILRRHRGPLVLSNTFTQLYMSCFVQRTFAIKTRSHQKAEQM